MDDRKIIELYWQRDESAIEQTDLKYGRLCRGVAYGILGSREDGDECVNDTYMAAWESLPPQRPVHFPAWLCSVTRNFSLNRIRASLTQKRGGGAAMLVYDELEQCLISPESVEKEYETKELKAAVETFLRTFPKADRKMFMYRYWLMMTVPEIARRMDCRESRVTSSLYRSRQKLRGFLSREELI